MDKVVLVLFIDYRRTKNQSTTNTDEAKRKIHYYKLWKLHTFLLFLLHGKALLFFHCVVELLLLRAILINYFSIVLVGLRLYNIVHGYNTAKN